MDSFYVYLNSKDSLDVRKNNNPADFFIQFPKSYQLDGIWTCAVTDVTLLCDFIPRSKRLYLCCDLVEDSYVRNTSLPILVNIEIESRYKKLQHINYSSPTYIPVSSNYFNSVHLFLKDEDLTPVTFKGDDIHCVLHFKKSWAR